MACQRFGGDCDDAGLSNVILKRGKREREKKFKQKLIEISWVSCLLLLNNLQMPTAGACGLTSWHDELHEATCWVGDKDAPSAGELAATGRSERWPYYVVTNGHAIQMRAQVTGLPCRDKIERTYHTALLLLKLDVGNYRDS